MKVQILNPYSLHESSKAPKKDKQRPNLSLVSNAIKTQKKKRKKKSTLSIKSLSPSSISKQKTKAEKKRKKKRKKEDIINKISNKANETLGRMDDSW